MVPTHRRDWFRILTDLAAAGMSKPSVARKCNRDLKTIYGWCYGSEPKETDARIVLALYFKHCPDLYRKHEARFEVRAYTEGSS